MKHALIALALVPALLLGACKEEAYPLTSQESDNAMNGARDFADRQNARYVGCSGQDSPPVDGYVTCTIAGIQAPHTETELVCGYKSRGCKRK